ncbi:hypothetical protein ACLB2K_034747 [Fragaria x ananassa]
MAPKAEKKPAEKKPAEKTVAEKAQAEKKPKARKNLPKEAGADQGGRPDSVKMVMELGGGGDRWYGDGYGGGGGDRW